jgi:Transposase and inactivated derivatives
MKVRATPQELAIIKDAMNKEKMPRVHRRYRALYLFLSGKTCKEVAGLMGITAITVSNINRTYRSAGLAGILDKTIPGRPSRLTQEQRDELKQVILNKLPSEVGFPDKGHWTAEVIGGYVKQAYGYQYSIRGITRMLEHMGIVYIRPNYVLAQREDASTEKMG